MTRAAAHRPLLRRPAAGLLAVVCLVVMMSRVGAAQAQQPKVPPVDPATGVRPVPADPKAAAALAKASAKPGDSAPAKPAPVKASAALSNPEPTFGDRLEVVVTLRYPTDVRAFFPRKPDLKPLLVLPGDVGRVERREEGGETVEVITLPVLAAKSGLNRTPEIEIPWHRVTASGGAGESGTVKLGGLRAVVKSQFAAATDVKAAPLPAAMPLVEENVPLKIGMLVLAMMLVAGLLTALGLRVYRNRARRDEPEPEIPPHVVAFGQLEQLLRSGRLQEGEPRLVLGEISAILRGYIGRRYRFAALDMTSTELLESLEGKDLRGIAKSEFEDFTSVGDLVKFARQPATPDFLREQLEWVRKVVDRTMQSPEEVERLRQQQLARLARQKRLRIQVMAPAQLRLLAFAIDALIGSGLTMLLAWLAIDTAQQALFDASYVLLLVWLGLRDLLGEGSPGKGMVGLRITAWDPAAEVDPDAALREDAAARRMSRQAQVAGFGARLQRNLLMILPGAGVVAEALTCWYLPEMRRLGDQWAETRVIDGRYGLRRNKPGWAPAVFVLVLAAAALALPLLGLGGRPQ